MKLVTLVQKRTEQGIGLLLYEAISFKTEYILESHIRLVQETWRGGSFMNRKHKR
jgi:hypothetical protein